MTVWKVKTDTLNLRSAPDQTDSSNIIRPLPLAQAVKVLDGSPTDRWWKVQTTIDDSTLTGFVSAAYLREPVSPAKEALIGAAVKEWRRFKQGKGAEQNDPFFRFVGEYWQAIGLPHDGRTRSQPWSAAFISFVARKAGYSTFKFAQAHHEYIRDAIEKRKSGSTTAPFWGFDRADHKPQLGDLVCKNRGGGSVTFAGFPSGFFPSHCDIVVEVRDTEVRAMGGNVSQSVSITSFPLDASGFLKKTDGVFAVLRNNN